MNITDLIVKKLENSENVVLPGIGTLVCTIVPPTYDPQTQTMLPEGKVISLQAGGSDDSDIVNAVVDYEKVNEATARTMWNNYIDALKDKLSHEKKHTFGEIGELQSDDANNYGFAMKGQTIYNNNAQAPITEVKIYDNNDDDNPFNKFIGDNPTDVDDNEPMMVPQVGDEKEPTTDDNHIEEVVAIVEEKSEEKQRQLEEAAKEVENKVRENAERIRREQERAEQKERERLDKEAAKKAKREKEEAKNHEREQRAIAKEAEQRAKEEAKERERLEKERAKEQARMDKEREKEERRRQKEEASIKKEKPEKKKKDNGGKRKGGAAWLLIVLLLLLVAGGIFYFLHSRNNGALYGGENTGNAQMSSTEQFFLDEYTKTIRYSGRDINANSQMVSDVMREYVVEYLAERQYRSALVPMMDRIQKYSKERLNELLGPQPSLLYIFPYYNYKFGYNRPYLKQNRAHKARVTVQKELLEGSMLDDILNDLINSLGLVDDGTAQKSAMEVQRLHEQERQAIDKQKNNNMLYVYVQKDSKQGYDVIAGFYLNITTAANLTARLRSQGCDAYIIEKNEYYYVSMGSASTQTKAEALYNHIKSWYDGDVVIRKL